MCLRNMLLLLLLLRRFSRVGLCATPWTAAHQAPLSKGVQQTRILEWVAISFSARNISIVNTILKG